MRNKNKLFSPAFILLFFIVLTSCKKLEKSMLVSTGEVTNISYNSSDASGLVIDVGEGAIQHGHCYGTSRNVTTAGSKTQLGAPPVGGFTSQLANLTAGTKYYIKAYISNGTETVYGKEISFTTTAAVVPTITTTDVTSITTSTAVSGGNITSDGGESITARGVCWGTSTGPTVTNSKTSDGTGTGSFASNLSGLAGGTTYYVRAYATNSAGTGYGNEISFTTIAVVLPTVSTAAPSNISSNSAQSGGNVSSDGGGEIIARGVCWSTSLNPTISDSKTEEGTGAGLFNTLIGAGGLNAATLYHVRAYATNSAGTAYGEDLTFTTLAGLPTITTIAVSDITGTGAVSGGNITNNGGSTIITRGVCWNTSTGPTTANSKTSDGTGIGSFTSSLTGLTASTTYYVRAYATNSVGTSYGDELQFTTLCIQPTLTTNAASNISKTTATLNATVNANNVSTIPLFQYGTTTNYGNTINSTPYSVDGTSDIAISVNIINLTPGTLYHFRVLAGNCGKEIYSNDMTFTTNSATTPTVTTISISEITSTSASSGGNVTLNGGATVTARGVCWSTSQNPTMSDSHTADGIGTGSFVSNITSLTPDSTYYVRAYATNSAGIGYGNQLSFTTDPVTVTDIDGNIYNVIRIGSQIWMKENLKTTKFNDNTSIPLVADNTTWAGLTSPGYCWYNNDEAGYKAIYGALYNWYTVDEASNSHKNICPIGWHVPNNYEWTTLTDYLGGESIAGGKMKEVGTTHWSSPNTGADNSSGLTALPGGYRNRNGTSFLNSGYNGYWWSISEYATVLAWYRQLSYNNSNVYSTMTYKSEGVSIRCLKD